MDFETTDSFGLPFTLILNFNVHIDETVAKLQFKSEKQVSGKNKEFEYLEFGSVSLNFAKKMSPFRVLHGHLVSLLKWESSSQTAMFLCSLSLFLLYWEWMVGAFFLVLLTPVRISIISTLVRYLELDTDNQSIKTMTLNLAFIQVCRLLMEDHSDNLS